MTDIREGIARIIGDALADQLGQQPGSPQTYDYVITDRILGLLAATRHPGRPSGPGAHLAQRQALDELLDMEAEHDIQ